MRCHHAASNTSAAPKPRAAPRRVAELRGAEVVVSRALIDAAGRGEAVVVRDPAGSTSTLGAQGIGAAMAAPIHTGDRVAGFVYVDHSRTDRFGPDELALLAAVATLIGAIVDGAERVDRAEARAEAAGLATPVLLGASPPMLALRRDVERLGPTELGVHVAGETGVGKEVVARALHALSGREGPFVAVDLGAIPEGLAESELFGHRKGAFPGADRSRPGAFRAAEGGTLFLDELGNLPLALQAKLLRALQERTVRPVGESKEVPFDTRVVASTHRDLEAMIARGARIRIVKPAGAFYLFPDMSGVLADAGFESTLAFLGLGQGLQSNSWGLVMAQAFMGPDSRQTHHMMAAHIREDE